MRLSSTSSDASVFKVDQLEDGKTYSIGRSISAKRKRLSGSSTTKHTSNKSIKVTRGQPIGALQQRESDLRHDVYSTQAALNAILTSTHSTCGYTRSSFQSLCRTRTCSADLTDLK